MLDEKAEKVVVMVVINLMKVEIVNHTQKIIQIDIVVDLINVMVKKMKDQVEMKRMIYVI